MTWLVPFFLLAGFLMGGVSQDANAQIIVPLLLAGFILPGAHALYRTDRVRGTAWMVLLLVFGWALAEGLRLHANVVFDRLFGPLSGGVPLAFPFFLAALALGVTVLVRHYREHPVSRIVLAGLLGVFLSALIVPAGFSFGLWMYHGVHGLFSFLELGFWGAAMALATLSAEVVFRARTKVLPLAASLGLFYAVAFFTGIAMSHLLWLPGILGLLFLQFGFLARHYL